MIRSKLRDLAYAWSRTTAFSVTQTQMNDFLVIAAQDFARDAGGLQESLTIMPSGAERSFDLPEGTQDVFSVYYDDEIEGELIEAPDVRVLADPDYRAGTLSTFPTSYAVQAGRPPVIWLDAVPDAGKDLRLIVFKNSIGWADGDDEEPELSSSYQVAIAFKAAAYAAMTQFDESVRLLRETEYKAKVDRYVEERGRKQSTAARLRAPPRLSRSGEWGGGGGLLGILAEGESEMGVTLDQVYTFLKTILESSSEARLRISANDVTKRIEFQPASTTGLNETEVDTRVAAGVEGWAEANSADTIPVDKIPADIARDAEVDKSIVDGVADWARLPDESIRIPTDKLLPVYSSGMIWGIWNAAITPGFQSFANTYEFGSSNFGTYQSSARPSVSAATRYLYIHVPIIEPDIEQWTTEGGSDQFAELVKQGSTHVYNGTTYKWWRSRNKIALSIILNGKRWRFYNLKDELTAKEVLEVDARVAAKVEDWAEDSNTDLIPSTKLPAPVGIDQAAVDARVKAGVEDWAETSNDDPIPATKLTNAPSGGGVSGGLNQAAVDVRVAAGVQDWAETSDTTVIPKAKLPTPVVPGLDQSAVDARVVAGVESWAAEGDVTVIPTTKLPAPVVPGLDQSAVDARVAAKVEDWAEDGNADLIPAKKLTNAPSGSGGGLNQAAVDARVVAGVESWAAEGDVEVIPTDKLPAPVVPGLDQAAVDARVAAKVEDWAEEGDQSAIPAAKLTNAPSGGSVTAASSYTDVLTWTRNSDFVNGVVYQTGVEVDVAKDFMHIALHQESSENAPAELAFMRIRTAEWLALPVDTEPSGGRFRENDDNSGILVYATDDVFQVITLHLRRYVSSSKNLLSVGVRINTSDPPSGRINGIRYFYEHSGAVGSSGLDQAAVDARVAAKVEDWAEDGNADAIPAKKLTNAPAGGGSGLNQAAVDARVVAGVESWAAEGDVEVIPTDKLPAPVVPGLNQAAVDARVVAGVESWAAEGDTDVIPTAKLPTPGLDQAAVDARVAAGVEDWAEDGNPSVVPAAKLPAALAATASSHTDVVTWTHTSDFSPNTLYHTAIEVDASMAFMHIALNVSGTSTPRELGFMRIRTAEWLALTEDNTLSGGSFTENNVRSGILAYATDDRYNVISLHLRRYTNAGKSLMSVGIKVLTSDTPAADINGIRYFYEHPGTVGSGGGLNQTAVDARVAAGVQDWAETLNTEVIPTAKLPAPVVPGLNQAAVDARVVAGVESWAAEGDVEVIPTAKLPAPVVPGLNQAAVDARVVAGVESWAAEGDTDLIPSTKLPAPVGIDQSAVDARVAAKVEDWAEDSNTDTIPLAKLPTLASPYTDSVSLTFTGDLTADLLYRTAIEVDMTKDFMHIALSVSGTSTPRELEYARIRTDEWLALAVDTTADAGTFVESDGKSGILAYATDDRFNVIVLHLRRYVSGGKNLLSIGIKIAVNDTPASDINGIRYFYETAGTASGINRADVNALVKSGVQDWAETSNLDTIPTAKLPPAAVGSSDITILGPRHTLVKADYLASKTLWNGQELVPITREVTDAHNAIYRFAAIDSTPGSGSIGKEIISLTFNYAVMRSSFNQNLTRSWTWVAGQAVAVGDMSYTDPSGSLKHHRCIRSHTTSTSGADGPPDSANQTGWQPYSLRSIANKANYLGVYNTSGEVASASLADGKWIITTAGQFVIAQIYNGGGWSSYIIPSIGSFNGTNFADHDAAGNAVQYYNASQPDYFMVNDIVNILTFLIPADAGVEGFHGTAPEKRDPVIVLWGRGQSSRLGNDDANGPATNAEGDVFPGGSVSGAFQRLRWKDNPSESYFGANRGMFRTVSPGFSALTGIDHRPDPFPSGHAFQLAPGLWSFRCWIDVPWLPESFPSVRIIKMRTGGTDYVLGSSQAAASHTPDSQIGTPDQNYVSSSEALYIDIGQNDILYVIVVGFSTNKNVGKLPFQHMFCWYHG